MASFNKVIIAGNVARDIEIRHVGNGTAVADVSLAINSQWKDKNSNEKKEEVTFVDCTLWGKTAETAGQYLSKGSPVLFEGRLHLETWEDKKSGSKRSKLKVIVETMQFLGSPPGKSGGQRQQGGGGRDYSEHDQSNDNRRGGNYSNRR